MLSKSKKDDKTGVLRLFWVFIAIFLFLQILMLVLYPRIYWDSAVYIGIAKFLFSAGHLGFMEIIRPIGLSLLIGPLWKLGIDVILASRILAIAFSILFAYSTFLLGSRVFNKETGLLSSVLVMTTSSFFFWASQPMTDIPSITFCILAIYFLLGKKYWLVGLFSSLAFLFRWPSGLVLAVCGLAMAAATLISLPRGNYKAQIKKNRKNTVGGEGKFYSHFFPLFVSILKMLIAFAIPVMMFMAFNYAIYHGETAKVSHALFRPWILGIWHQENPAEAIHGIYANLMYYLFEMARQNFLLLLSIAGLILLARAKFWEDSNKTALMASFLIFFSYYTYIGNKQPRFLISFLPFVAILSAYAILHFTRNQRILPAPPKFMPLLVTIFVIAAISGAALNVPLVMDSANYNPGFKKGLNKAFANLPFGTKIITNTPVPAAYLDYLFVPNYYSQEGYYQAFATDQKAGGLVYISAGITCFRKDIDCQNTDDEFLQILLQRFNLIAVLSDGERPYYIFSKDETLPSLNDKYLLDRAVTLSRIPYGGNSIIVLRMDNAAGVYREDGKGNIWKAESFSRILNDLNSTPLTLSIIPADLLELNNSSLDLLRSYISTHDIAIAQNGFSYHDYGLGSEFAGRDYASQWNDIEQGRNIIEDKLGIVPLAFVPPYSSSDKNTLKALASLGYIIYSSVPGDPIVADEYGLKRYDQGISMVKDWASMKNKDADALISEYEASWPVKPYVLLAFQHFNFETGDFASLVSFVEYAKDHRAQFMNLDQLHLWLGFLDGVQLTASDNNIGINVSPEIQEKYPDFATAVTLSIKASVNMSVSTNLQSIILLNSASKPITVCLPECTIIDAGNYMRFQQIY
ncbi:MAG: hypothetical protein QS98_C0014G0015 [archaeon GW2011_AR3]|nr:MAG: hypothetical protein QS98_C0014G0015 [archaeon GW2011_AR3]MBS3109264.1 glycosyltransferase family 39 protein [Candidatus Woesearchaeota archaeon]